MVDPLQNYLRNIAIDAVLEKGEVDSMGVSLGHCKPISERIIMHMVTDTKLEGTPCMLVGVSPPTPDGGLTNKHHYAVWLSKQQLVIDTQVWQYVGERTDIMTRKVIFTWREYAGKGFVIHQSNINPRTKVRGF